MAQYGAICSIIPDANITEANKVTSNPHPESTYRRLYVLTLSEKRSFQNAANNM